MSGAGKPLRFLGLLVGGWIVLRLGAMTAPLLWTPAQPDQAARPVRQVPSPGQIATAPQDAPPTPLSGPVSVTRSKNRAVTPKNAAPRLVAAFSREPSAEAAPTRSMILAVPPRNADAREVPPPTMETVRPLGETSIRSPSRWSFTGWVLWRRDGGASLAQAPLLGGSQGGVRLDYRLWSEGRRSMGLYGRVTRALDRPFAEEAALGVALRPVEGLPVTLLAERRQRLGDGGRSGFALLAAGGLGPKPIGPRLELEGYAQAGLVGLPGSDGFADGRLSLDYRLARSSRRPDLAFGLVLSGGAQTGVSRLDIGPELRFRLPVAEGHMRLSVEWRERIAGSARPPSGPAVTLVTDF